MIPFHPLFDSFEVIGRGSSATIYKAVHLPTNIAAALKSIYQPKDPIQSRYLQREFEIHRTLDHPFIASYFGEYYSNDQRVMVLEFVKGQTLLDAINKSGAINIYNAHRIFCQVVSALKYLHTVKKIAHRDLKLENIMINFQGNVKLLDFGFANINLNALTTQCASIPYAAPEIFRGQKHSLAVDIWSLGVILYGMLSGKLPFGDSDIVSISKSVLNQPPIYNIECIPEEIRGLIAGMLEPDPLKRFTISQIEMHDWVQLNPFKNLISENFYRKAELLSFPPNQILDPNVLKIMDKYSIDYSEIDPERFEIDFNDSLMAYKIIKRSQIHSRFNQIYMKTIMETSSPVEADLLCSTSRLPTLYSYLKNDDPSSIPKKDPLSYLKSLNQNNIENNNNQGNILTKKSHPSLTSKSLNRPSFVNMPLRRHSNMTHKLTPITTKVLSPLATNSKYL